ncbi:hypothetical protein [Rufibacter hautae]|uniref:Uncharacterized protein n=1 Tax=Rufibacter hautae TaxID=2595005 RepID=A0A5B6TEV0_9BACT|nr:hypothetical protein [Rufibacter hautae]KAA3439162.1 hypothetical protein FOA19_00305 [Rufibacter hautae]
MVKRIAHGENVFENQDGPARQSPSVNRGQVRKRTNAFYGLFPKIGLKPGFPFFDVIGFKHTAGKRKGFCHRYFEEKKALNVGFWRQNNGNPIRYKSTFWSAGKYKDL